MRNLARICAVLLFLGGIATAVWGWYIVHNPERFPVRHVRVVGNYEHVTPAQIQAMLLPQLQKSFITLNVAELQASINKLSPWIDKVQLVRIWPDVLQVRLFERNVVAAWNQKQLMTADEQIFVPPANTFPTNLPLLFGPEGSEAMVWQQYLQLSQILSPWHLRIAALSVSDRRSVQLLLTNGTEIRLGRLHEAERLSRWMQAYAGWFSPPYLPAKIVDLRYENGFAMTWSHL